MQTQKAKVWVLRNEAMVDSFSLANLLKGFQVIIEIDRDIGEDIIRSTQSKTILMITNLDGVSGEISSLYTHHHTKGVVAWSHNGHVLMNSG